MKTRRFTSPPLLPAMLCLMSLPPVAGQSQTAAPLPVTPLTAEQMEAVRAQAMPGPSRP